MDINKDIDLSNPNAFCGWFNVKTGESGTFISKKEVSDYVNLPWWKKIFTRKPKERVVSYINPYRPPEFYNSFTRTRNWIAGGLFKQSSVFQTESNINIYIERNIYSEDHDRFFYEVDGERVYLDSKALKQGHIAKLLT